MSDSWSREEVEVVVSDYFEMLVCEFRGEGYNKRERARNLLPLLRNRSHASIEYKRRNISAVLIDIGFPFIGGYKPLFNYQNILYDIVVARISSDASLRREAVTDADRATEVPSVENILSVLVDPPVLDRFTGVRERPPWKYGTARPESLGVNYLEREARNAALGAAGEEFVVRYETARLLSDRKDSLAANIVHASRIWGDGVGFDILSFENSGAEKLIEVKTTKYGAEAAFYISDSERNFSEQNANAYHLYRLFTFRADPHLFTLQGSLSSTCALNPNSYRATPL
jgi:hypothetical protein